MMFSITYKDGRGHMRINLDSVIPCTAGDMKRIISVIDLSDDADGNAAIIYNYISGKVADLKKERAQFSESSAVGKKEITKINAILKRYLANAAALVKLYNLPELEDNAAQVVYKSGIVYAVIFNASTCPGKAKTSIESFNGWTFEKDGYIFDIRKAAADRKAGYIIMLHDTGLKVAESTTKAGAAAEITPRILDALKNGAEKIQEAKAKFKELMIAAGYMEAEPERSENISNDDTAQAAQIEKGEAETMYSFTSNTITCNGKTFSAEYNISADGSVIVFAIINTTPDGRKEKQRIRFTPEHADHAAALEAAKEYKAGCERPETISTGYVKIATPAGNVIEKAPAAAEKSADPEPVQVKKEYSAGKVPEKTFIGEVITGNGWRILFDGETSRTRVIFTGTPTEAARAAVESAGFYYSKVMNSWNKKLTFKAYRAAKALAIVLKAIYENAA